MWLSSVFFFQAEDGIRDGHVTGVQTCALPISMSTLSGDYGPSSLVGTIDVDMGPAGVAASPNGRYVYVVSQVQRPVVSVGPSDFLYGLLTRSEERRVGKECRSRGWAGADIRK